MDRRNSITINASTPEEALHTAALEFLTNEKNIAIAPIGNNLFEASVKNADAECVIEITQDRMDAVLVDYLPPIGDGKELTEERLQEIMSNAGIKVDPDPQGMELLFKSIAEEREFSRIVIARGEPAQEAEEAWLKPEGDLLNPVFPQDIFARKVPATTAKAGYTVDGQEILPRNPHAPKDIAITTVKNCSLTADKTGICAEAYGLATISGVRTWVDPLIRPSDDKMQAQTTMFANDFKGNPVTSDKLRMSLRSMEIKADLDNDAVLRALSTAQSTGQAQEDIIIVSGTPPQDGEDAQINMSVDVGSSVGEMQTDGSVNFHERGTVHSVTAGQLLAKITPPTLGVPGKDIYGNDVAAKDGEPAAIASGENVAASEDGLEFYSGIEGMVLFSRNILSVTEVFEVNGDIDFKTGNIRTDKGSIYIKGSVRSTFEVMSPANIIVEESVESATLEAEGDIEIKRGIQMHEDEGHVKARGNIRCRFAQNAHIEAEEDVIIDNDVTNCEIKAGGKVITTQGKGKIQGGIIRCNGGIEANEIGSDMGVHTEIVVGMEREAHSELHQKKVELVNTVAKIDKVIGTGSARDILIRTPPPKRKIIASLLKARIGTMQKLEEIEHQIAIEEEHRLKSAKAKIVVNKIIHPGCIINIGGCVLNIERSHSACQFMYSPEEGTIISKVL